MKRPRFSIAALLAFVLACGLGLAALKSASGMWASVMVTAAAVALLTSIVGAAKGRNRAGWFGFAVFAWGYLLLNFAPWCRDVVHPHLLTTLAIVESYGHVHKNDESVNYATVADPGESPIPMPARLFSITRDLRDQPRFLAVPGVGPARRVVEMGYSDTIIRYGSRNFDAYEVSGHALMTILVGLLGWFVAGLIADRRPEGER